MNYSIESLTIQRDCVLKGLRITVPGRVLFEHADVSFPNGSKTAIIGANGCGKSSMLRCLQEVLKDRAVTLEQFGGDQKNDLSIIDTVLQSDSITFELLKREKELTDLSENEDVEFTIELCEELDMIQENLRMRPEPHEAHKILHGLGFTDTTTPCCSLSGGWLQRLSLAKALYARPAMFILDEPTNHLDIDGICWLSDYLIKYPRTLVLVTHDISFCEPFIDRWVSICEGNVKTLTTENKKTKEV